MHVNVLSCEINCTTFQHYNVFLCIIVTTKHMAIKLILSLILFSSLRIMSNCARELLWYNAIPANYDNIKSRFFENNNMNICYT